MNWDSNSYKKFKIKLGQSLDCCSQKWDWEIVLEHKEDVFFFSFVS